MGNSRNGRNGRNNRGFVGIAVAVVILLLVGGFITTLMSASGSSLLGSLYSDTASSAEATRALFLAESGLEYAIRKNLDPNSPTSCSALGNSPNVYTVSGFGSFRIANTTENPYWDNNFATNQTYTQSGSVGCRVRVTGITTSGRQRTIESIVVPYNSAAKTNSTPAGTGGNNFQINQTIVADNLLYVIAMAWSITYTNSSPPSSGTNGSIMNAAYPQMLQNGILKYTLSSVQAPAISGTYVSGSSTTVYYAQMFYYYNMAPGTYSLTMKFDGTATVSFDAFASMSLGGTAGSSAIVDKASFAAPTVGSGPKGASWNYPYFRNAWGSSAAATSYPTVAGDMFMDVITTSANLGNDATVQSSNVANCGYSSGTTMMTFDSPMAEVGVGGQKFSTRYFVSTGSFPTTGYCFSNYKNGSPPVGVYQAIRIRAASPTSTDSNPKVTIPGAGVQAWREVEVY